MESKSPLESDFESLDREVDESLMKFIQEQSDNSADQKLAKGIKSPGPNESGQLPTASDVHAEKPTETLNTRIPKSLYESIEDHIYHSRKRGKPITKQQLTIDALSHFLGLEL